MSKARFWTFTIFSTEDYDLPEAVADIIMDKIDGKSCTYAIVGYETCPSTGRKHCQGYVEFKNPRAMGGVKTWLGVNHAHIEKRRENGNQYVYFFSLQGAPPPVPPFFFL